MPDIRTFGSCGDIGPDFSQLKTFSQAHLISVQLIYKNISIGDRYYSNSLSFPRISGANYDFREHDAISHTGGNR